MLKNLIKSQRDGISSFLMVLLVSATQVSQAKPVLQSIQVNVAPQVDGNSDDSAWSRAPLIITHDRVADIDIQIQSVHTNDDIYMLVKFPDATENLKHKVLHWNEAKQRYLTGPEREDVFVFKWNMLPVEADISINSDTPYKADIWYWKSMRTNHAGYADDKFQTYELKKTKQARLLISKKGNYFYLSRKGDKGRAAYKPAFYEKKTSDTVSKYKLVQPKGSRADIRAKGVWKDGVWTVEFRRALYTGHTDDLQFDFSPSYYFGVSRYEIAGRKPDNDIEQVDFGSGDINELIELRFIVK